MKEAKYIYGKYSPDTVPHEEYNEFHALSEFLGAYLVYSNSPEYASYSDYVADRNLKKECLEERFRWTYINKAHIFLRSKLNENTDKVTYISKRQIRKLGYSGIGAQRMYPIKGSLVQSEMFRLVFYTKELEQVKNVFLDYFYDKIRTIDSAFSYLDRVSGKGAAKFVFRTFISFQFPLLSGPRGNLALLRELEVDTYKEIQQFLNERG